MNRNIRVTLTCLCMLLGLGYLHADPIDPSTALKTKDYAALARLYQGEIDKSPTPTSTMYYNLGVAYMLMGQKAEAVKHYEMALYLEPTCSEARDNLNLIYKNAPNSLGDGRSPLSKIFDPLCYALPMGTWAILALILFALALSALVLYALSKTPRNKRVGFYSASALMLLVLLANAAIGHQRYYRTALEHSLTLRDVTSLFSTPEPDAEVLATLPALSSLPFMGERGDWLEVVLRDGRRGWVRKTEVTLPLMPPSP